MTEKLDLPPVEDLGYACVDVQSRRVDWDEETREDPDRVTVHLPTLTADVLRRMAEEHDDDAFNPDTYADPDFYDDPEEDAEQALEQAREAFEQSDEYVEWQDGFWPVMNAFWPCEVAYGLDDGVAAARIEAYAGPVTLVTVDGDQGLALTGGGMDLSWNLAAAYVCCGQIPPLCLLAALPRYAGGPNVPRPVAEIILACLSKAADGLESRARRLREERDQLAADLSS